MREFFVDFHSHPTLRAINTPSIRGYKNMWDKTFNNTSLNTSVSRWARMKTREISKESQTNFYAYAENNFRIVFDSLYPVEKGWLKFRKMPSVIVGEKAQEEMMMVAMGIEKERLEHLRKGESYFEELNECYEFLLNGQGDSPDGNFNYRLVSSFEQLDYILRFEPNTLAVVVNIEGAHALECGTCNSLEYDSTNHKKILGENILKLKSWQHPPFSITIAHHYFNQLCGHARSFKHPFNLIFDQKYGIGFGILELGWFVIEELLSKKNGKRILIDIKHMSVQSRKDYYQFIKRHNTLFPEDRIPIICSHTGVSGYETMEDACCGKDNRRKSKKSYYNNWTINLSNDEIKNIHESEGMIGIMMDKGLLGAPKTLKRIRRISDPDERECAYLKLMLDNVFTVIKAVGEKSAWNILTLGTDYDGLITHIDGYDSVAKIPQLKSKLIDYLNAYNYERDYWFGMNPEELMDKVFATNLVLFLKKNLS